MDDESWWRRRFCAPVVAAVWIAIDLDDGFSRIVLVLLRSCEERKRERGERGRERDVRERRPSQDEERVSLPVAQSLRLDERCKSEHAASFKNYCGGIGAPTNWSLAASDERGRKSKRSPGARKKRKKKQQQEQ